MTTLSHSCTGIIITRLGVDAGLLPAGTLTPYIIGVICANLPDVDGLVSLRRLYDHHNSMKNVSHYPVNWLLVLLLALLLALPFNIRFLLPYLLLAGVNVLLHFVLDTFSIYHGIAWLGPWNTKKFSFIRMLPIIPADTNEWVHWYTKHWVMYLEIALWIVTLLLLFDTVR